MKIKILALVMVVLLAIQTASANAFNMKPSDVIEGKNGEASGQTEKTLRQIEQLNSEKGKCTVDTSENQEKGILLEKIEISIGEDKREIDFSGKTENIKVETGVPITIEYIFSKPVDPKTISSNYFGITAEREINKGKEDVYVYDEPVKKTISGNTITIKIPESFLEDQYRRYTLSLFLNTETQKNLEKFKPMLI